MADLHARGIRAIVDLTTVDLGRDIGLILDVARRSRVHVIVATGVWWMPQRYFSGHGVDAVAELFVRDITQGIGESGVKAAIITCATDTAGVTPVIENVLRASARAQKATGVPISTHTWAAGRTGEAQQAIFAQEGVDLRRVIIGHSGDSEDLGYLRGLMDRGSTIGMDRFGLEHFLPTPKRVEPNGTLLRSWGEPGTDPGQFNIPHNICCDADGWVYVADRENHRVQVFDGDGRFETQWHDMHRPSGLFMERGGEGRFYVGEIGGALPVNYDVPNIGPRVSIYSHRGERLARLGDRLAGLEPGQFVSPHGLAVDSRGDIYVGEVSYTNWGNRYKGQPLPPGLRSLQKLVKEAT
jgi:hypothetical protein